MWKFPQTSNGNKNPRTQGTHTEMKGVVLARA